MLRVFLMKLPSNMPGLTDPSHTLKY
uniref:Uncharacterized protein n=1 Tax=Anguilla anguilla TaxID=7936 RepID=A0A0E9QCG5_ANGAN